MKTEQKLYKQKDSKQSHRQKLIKIFSTKVMQYIMPFKRIEIITEIIMHLSLLKFVIDYFAHIWFSPASSSSFTPIALYLDLSFYFTLVNVENVHAYILIFAIWITIYWMIILTMFRYGVQQNNLLSNIRKLLFLVNKNIFCIPSLHFTLQLLACNNPYPSKCLNYSLYIKILCVLTEAIFLTTILLQTYLDIEFIERKDQPTRMKHTSKTSLTILSFALLSQVVFFFTNDLLSIIYINAATLLLFGVVIYRDDQYSQIMKLVQIGTFAVLVAFSLYLDLIMLTQREIPFYPIIFILFFLVFGIMKKKTTNLKFELQNINKWPTPNIMISYAKTLRYYLSRKSQYYYKISIHGYMQIHRQKCQNPTCPSRIPFTKYQNSLFTTQKQYRQNQQSYRTENIIKKIYSDGYKLNPIQASLQLQNCIFLYQKNQKQKSLKNLLSINYRKLSFDQFYKFDFLKTKIYKDMIEQPTNFMNLIDQIQQKQLQKVMMKKLEQCSLITLQFWSIFNEDHPNFTKLNEIAIEFVKRRQELKEVYRLICNLVYNQKLTLLYIIYLQNIQNDQQQFQNIHKQTVRDYQLGDKVVLEDWSNSSGNILVVSVENNNGEIIYINSNCASLFGYQKFQLINQSLNLLLIQEGKFLQAFLNEEAEEEFYILQKSGFLMKIKRKRQSYNSLETGLAIIFNITQVLQAYHCSFLFDKSHKIIGFTSSVISVLNIQPRLLESQQKNQNHFTFQLQRISQFLQSNPKPLKIHQLIKQANLNSSKLKTSLFKLSYNQSYSIYNILEITQQTIKKQGTLNYKPSMNNNQNRSKFTFQCNFNSDKFKYIGLRQQSHFIPQFGTLFQEHAKNRQPSQQYNYAAGISTYRLYQNAIQVIQDLGQFQFQQKIKTQEELSQNMVLSKQQEEQIFHDKKTFGQFVQARFIGRYIYFIFIIITILILALYILEFYVYRTENNNIKEITTKVKDLSELVSIISKQQNFISRLELAHLVLAQENATKYMANYELTLKKLQEMQVKGFDTYPLKLTIDDYEYTVFNREFMLTTINYANIFISKVKRPPKDLNELYAAFSLLDVNQRNYLKQVGSQAELQLLKFSIQLENSIKQSIGQYEQMSTVLIVVCSLAIAISFIILFYSIYYLNRQKIQIFQIFLDIPEATIQELSNKAQKVLISLHTQESNDIAVDDDLQNLKKNSSTFAKKKSLKQINFSKLIYGKFVIIAAFFLGYFIQVNITAGEVLQFQGGSIDYFNVVALLGNQFYSSLTNVQKAMIQASNNHSLSETSTAGTIYQKRLRGYYAQLLKTHFKTFGQNVKYHDAFNKVMYGNICEKQETSYGSFQIAQACQIGELASKGTFYIVQNMIIQMATRNTSDAIPQHIYLYSEVISTAHSLLNQFLQQCQQSIISTNLQELTIVLIIWIFLIVGILVLWIIPNLKFYLDEINMIKNIISIIPISYAVGSFKVKKYLRKLKNKQI